MNITTAISKHIMDNLGFSAKSAVSLKSKDYLLRETLDIFESDDDSGPLPRIWAAEINLMDSKMMIAASEINTNEYVCIVSSANNCMGIYLIDDFKDYFSNIGIYSKTFWMDTNIQMQAGFLGGMEELREMNKNWLPCSEMKKMIQLLESFVKYNYRKIES